MNRPQFVASLFATAVAATIPARASLPAKSALAYTGEMRMWCFGGCPRVIAPSAAEAVALAVREGYNVAADVPRLMPPDEEFTIFWSDGPPHGLFEDDVSIVCECSAEDVAFYGCGCEASTARTTLTAAGWAEDAEKNRHMELVIGEFEG